MEDPVKRAESRNPNGPETDLELSRILDWIHRHTRESSPGKEIAPDTSLLEGGIFDSLHIVELSLFLEDDFGISLPPDGMGVKDLETPAHVAAMVRRLRASQPG